MFAKLRYLGSAEKLKLICFTILFCPKARQAPTFCLDTESRQTCLR